MSSKRASSNKEASVLVVRNHTLYLGQFKHQCGSAVCWPQRMDTQKLG